MIDYKEYDERDQTGENDEDRFTDDIYFLKMGTLSAHKNIENIDKKYNEGNCIDNIDDKESVKRDQIGERKANGIQSE